MDFFSPTYNPRKTIEYSFIDTQNMKVLLNRIKDCSISNELNNIIYKRIQQHINKDLKHNKSCLINEYITITDVINLLKNQNNKCNFCGEEMNLVPTHTKHSRDLNAFSIDRINNKKPHMKGNCVISCFFCNTTRGLFKGFTKNKLKKELLELKKNKRDPIMEIFNLKKELSELKNICDPTMDIIELKKELLELRKNTHNPMLEISELKKELQEIKNNTNNPTLDISSSFNSDSFDYYSDPEITITL